MQHIVRRLIVIGAVVMSGAAAGVALGDFVARPGPGRPPDVAAAPAPAARFDDPLDPVVAAAPVRAASVGPSSYSCEGCDARLHEDEVAGEAAFADVEPLPAYRPQEDVVPERPPVRQAAVTPRVQVPGITLPGIDAGNGPAAAQKAAPVTVDAPRPESWR
ncbi:MAG TPA: hypothetical protein VNS79_10640 [Sphingobium sp.]|nr:hypothetical protein [Sphingobium sp.]